MKYSLWLLFWFVFTLTNVSFAQDFFSFLSPKAPGTAIDVNGSFTPERDLNNGPDKSQVLYSGIGVAQRIYEDGKNNFSVGARYQKLDLNDQAEFVRDYYNIRGSLSYRRLTEKNKFWSASVDFGYASDEPFKSGRDATVGANFLKQFNQRWFGIVNYSNNRSFLNNIPLPGFFYVKEMTPERALIVGFPIVYWMTPINESWSFRYFGALPWTHRARLLYTNLKTIRPYLGYEQAPETFFRHDREEREDRFFWFERKLALGIEGGLTKEIRYDLSSGLAFDREFYEARNFSEEKKNRYRIENGYFVGLTMRFVL